MARLERALYTEFAATGVLSAGLALIASGTTAVAPGQPGLQLLVASVLIGALIVILLRAPSGSGGGYLNPIVCAAVGLRERARYEWLPGTALFLLVQMGGAAAGVWLADLFLATVQLPAAEPIPHLSGYAAEGVAGAVVAVVAYLAPAAKRPLLLGVICGVICWSMGSLSFGNPAMALASALAWGGGSGESNNVALRALAQLLGAAVALGVLAGLFGGQARASEPDHK